MSVKYYPPKQGAFFVLCASILFLVATPVEAFKEHKRDILMLKIALGISCTTAGGVLLWQHRPSRIDDTLSALEKNQEKLIEAKETLEKQANEVVNTKINEFNQILVAQQEENLRLKEQLAEAHYPKLPPETTPANCHCRAVQLALWREGIIFDWDKHDPPAYVRAQKGRNYQQYVFEPRNQSHLMKFIKAKSEVPSLCEYALGNEGAVNVSQQGNRVIIRYYPGEMTTTEKAEIELAKKPVN